MQSLSERMSHAVERWLSRNPGKTRSQIDALAGVGKGTVSRIVTGARKNQTSQTITKLAQVLEVDAAWLGNGIGPAPRFPEHRSVSGHEPQPARVDRYAYAPEVIEKLIDARKLDPKRARELVGGIAFDEGAGYGSALDLYELALQALADEQGKAVGHREVTDDDDL